MAVVGRLALVLALAVLVAASCNGDEPTPTKPAATTAPTTETDPPAPSEPQSATATDAAADPGPDAGSDDPAATAGELTGDGPPGESDSDTSPPAGLSADTAGSLALLLDELARLADEWDPVARASLAVVTPDGTLYGFNENRQHISASAVKPIWTAAAIDLAGPAAVAPLGPAALVQSDNFAAGEIIDLIGIDSVNTWSAEAAGTTGTHLAAWYFGTDRVAQSVIDGGSRANLTTVGDLALFYAGLQRGDLLDPEGFAALEEWLRATDRGATPAGTVRGALLTRLPGEVAAAAIHKAGWLPPYCCAAEVRLMLDAGVIPLPDGSWFAIAAVSDRGDYYNLSVRWVSLASCRVYALLADDPSHSCDRPGDGVPRPDLWRPPPEPQPTADDAEEPVPESDEAEALPLEDEDGPGESPLEPDENAELPPEPGEDEDLPPEINEAGEVPSEADESDTPPGDEASVGTGSETPAPEPAGSEPGS
ncbi:MAG: serine hydrolase [bacterium]|nr:serine hydrolase [bacterium]